MTPTKDGKPLPGAVRNAEQIIQHLNEYLSIRFDHAIRIKPSLKTIKEDMLFHEIANVRRCLMAEKIYGPVRKTVSDVLVSDSDKERNQLFSATDQNSIQVELVSHVQDEKVESTRGQIRIHDIKNLYGCIEPDLLDLVDLIETWIWWDIPDAVELTRFEQKVAVVQLIEKGELPDKLRRRLSVLVHVPEQESEEEGEKKQPEFKIADDEEILSYEITQMKLICDRWAYRRKYELGYMFVLQRDRIEGTNQGEYVHLIAEKIREYDKIEHLEAMDDEIRHRWAPVLRIKPESVTRELIMQQMQTELVTLEKEMIEGSENEVNLGPPYNYKAKQFKKIKKWVDELMGRYGHLVEEIDPSKVVMPDDATAAAQQQAGPDQEQEQSSAEPLTSSEEPSEAPELAQNEDKQEKKEEPKPEITEEQVKRWEELEHLDL